MTLLERFTTKPLDSPQNDRLDDTLMLERLSSPTSSTRHGEKCKENEAVTAMLGIFLSRGQESRHRWRYCKEIPAKETQGNSKEGTAPKSTLRDLPISLKS